MRHLVKLCVGVSDVAYLFERAEALRAADKHLVIHTRQMPKAADELLAGGSLYWVVKGQILVRQPIVALTAVGTKDAPLCEIALAPDIVLTRPQPRRPFQGWRYLSSEDAPPDLESFTAGEGLPQDLEAQLRDLGAW